MSKFQTYEFKRGLTLLCLRNARATHNKKFIINTHQIALVCHRRGVKMPGFKQSLSPMVRGLMHKHVYSLLT